MRRSGHFLSVLLALGLLLAGLASSHAAQTRLIGDTDGKSFAAACPSGTAIIGFAYNSSDQLTAIVPFCQPVDGEGHTSGTVPKIGGLKGVAEGSQGAPSMCGEGQAVRQLEVTMTELSAVYSFRATCYGPGTAPRLTKATAASGGSPGSKGKADCKAGAVATSVVGTYKDTGARQGIYSIGLGCTALGEMADTAAPKETGGDDGNAEPADNGGDDAAMAKGGNDDDEEADDDGDGGTGLHIQIGPNGISVNGKVKGGHGSFAGRANTASMIYEQPGSGEKRDLKKGAKVSIIACDEEEEDWCEVAKPVHGWVWKPELDF